MKVISGILAIFFFSLTLVPCADEMPDEAFGSDTHYHTEDKGDHPEADLCSPFCQCACCQAHVINEHYYYEEVISFPHQDHQTNYIDDLGKDISDRFLRPPQK